MKRKMSESQGKREVKRARSQRGQRGRRGEGKRVNAHASACPSACMAVYELLKVRLHFHGITDYKIK
jgi:hypothetical protein